MPRLSLVPILTIFEKKCTTLKRDTHFSKVSAAPQRGAHLITMCGRGHAKWTAFVLKVREPRTAPRLQPPEGAPRRIGCSPQRYPPLPHTLIIRILYPAIYTSYSPSNYRLSSHNALLDCLQPPEGAIPTYYLDHLNFISSHLYLILPIEV